MREDEDVHFVEVQRFRQWWLWLLILPMPLMLVPLFGWGAYQQILLGRPFGDHPGSNTELLGGMIFAILIPLGVLLLFWKSSLTVKVTATELRVRFRPFHLRDRIVPLNDIRSAEARRYDPLGEFGGWGIRKGWRPNSGWAWNVSGEEGVQVELRDGRRILIGSQRAEELAAALTRGIQN